MTSWLICNLFCFGRSIPFYCNKKGMDRPEQNRVWINQDVLNCSHCTSRLGFTFMASLCSTWQLSEIGPAQHLNRLFIFLHISWWGARANVSSARAVPTALLWCSIPSGNVFGLQISAVTFYFSRARNFFAITYIVISVQNLLMKFVWLLY